MSEFGKAGSAGVMSQQNEQVERRERCALCEGMYALLPGVTYLKAVAEKRGSWGDESLQRRAARHSRAAPAAPAGSRPSASPAPATHHRARTPRAPPGGNVS